MKSQVHRVAPVDLEAKENFAHSQNKPTVPPRGETAPLKPSPPEEGWTPKTHAFRKALHTKHLPQPDQLQSKQPNVTPIMRSILSDWMMEVCAEFTLKRETFYLALNYADRALGSLPKIKKEEFQLVGLASMVLAAKTEEIYTPKLEDWAKSADDGYSLQEIKWMERSLLRSLNWQLFPVTSCTWLHWLMTQWDEFVTYHYGCVQFNNPQDFATFPKAVRRQFKQELNHRFIVFTASNKASYQRFRDSFQLLDLAHLDYDVLRFRPQELSVSVLFLLVNKCFIETDFELLVFGEDQDEPLDEVEARQIVQDLFLEFAQASTGLRQLAELHSCIEFLGPFLDVQCDYELPVACKYKRKSQLETHYHDFLAYQTHNPLNIDFISDRQ